jgi:hypothetical protein
MPDDPLDAYVFWSDVFRDCYSKERPQLQGDAALDPKGPCTARRPIAPVLEIEVLGRRQGYD